MNKYIKLVIPKTPEEQITPDLLLNNVIHVQSEGKEHVGKIVKVIDNGKWFEIDVEISQADGVLN